MLRLLHCLSVLLLLSLSALAQPTADSVAAPERTYHPGRLRTVLAAEAVAYAGTMAVLYGVWYGDDKHTRFHFYNDNKGWMQVDKLGHMYCAYTESYYGRMAMRWAGLSEKKAIWLGGGLGIILQTPIEILDGISKGWGASPGDLVANTVGSALVIGQELAWRDQRLKLKFSYSPSPYTKYRPRYFGTSFGENFIRDYNGHTYWLSANIRSFMPHWERVPHWLNVSLGLGAGGMLAEYANPRYYAGEPLPEFTRHRQFYLSFDADLTRIRTRSRLLKGVFTFVNLLKVPAPTLEYNKVQGLVLHPIYY